MSITRLKSKLKNGFVNCHAHIDRACTASYFEKQFQTAHLFEKWELVNKVKKESTEQDYYYRILDICNKQREQGVKKLISFIDLDHTVGTRALDAAIKVKKEVSYRGLELIIGNQTVGGFTPENLKLFEQNIDRLDFLGGLPRSDKDYYRHLDILFYNARKTGKKVHVHVDQLNTDKENETQDLAQRTIRAGLEGRVVAVHGISIACHPKDKRVEIYKTAMDAGLQFVSCPSAWIDHPRTERLSPTHNSITPIDELLEWGFVVGIGTDNIEDIYKPFCDGDMLFELRLALEACKIYDEDALEDLAYNNGLKIID